MSAPAPERQPDEGIPARDIIALLFDTSRLLCLHSDRLLGASIGLSEARARLIVTVSTAEPARMGKLADALGVSARSVTSMVDALERQGLLTREQDPDDRRATLLRLTEDSKTRMSLLHEAQRKLAEELLEPLNMEDRLTLHRLLAELRDHAERNDHGSRERTP